MCLRNTAVPPACELVSVVPKRYPYHQWAPDARALDVVGDKWTLLIVRDLSAGPRRCIELQRMLPGISSEPLRARLKAMVASGLVTRRRYREVPPRVMYELTASGRALLPVLGAVARWGWAWAWTAPREGERIDIGAIVRLMPGLAGLPQDIRGVAVFVVELDATMRSSAYTLIVDGGRVSIAHGEVANADVRVSGSQDHWVAALGPDGDARSLLIAGREPLATLLLDAIGICAFARAAGPAT